MVDVEPPKSRQETPKSSQKEPKRAPKRFQNHLWIENVDFSKMQGFRFIKPTFLRVGGSVWELKIDPKRLWEEMKNDIERRRKKKDKKRASITTKRAPKSFDTV